MKSLKPLRHHALLLLFAAMAASHSGAWAHANLQSTSPARDAQVSPSIKAVTLQFNEKLEASFSKARLVDSGGKEVPTAGSSLDPHDPSRIILAVPALAPGKYTVQFTVVGQDGHRRKGDYSFSVK